MSVRERVRSLTGLQSSDAAYALAPFTGML
jgi:hypothetical protein